MSVKERVKEMINEARRNTDVSKIMLEIDIHQDKFARITRYLGKDYGSQKENSLRGAVYLKRRIGGFCGVAVRHRNEILEIIQKVGLARGEEAEDVFDDMLLENGGGVAYRRYGRGYTFFALEETSDGRYKVFVP